MKKPSPFYFDPQTAILMAAFITLAGYGFRTYQKNKSDEKALLSVSKVKSANRGIASVGKTLRYQNQNETKSLANYIQNQKKEQNRLRGQHVPTTDFAKDNKDNSADYSSLNHEFRGQQPLNSRDSNSSDSADFSKSGARLDREFKSSNNGQNTGQAAPFSNQYINDEKIKTDESVAGEPSQYQGGGGGGAGSLPAPSGSSGDGVVYVPVLVPTYVLPPARGSEFSSTGVKTHVTSSNYTVQASMGTTIKNLNFKTTSGYSIYSTALGIYFSK